MVFVATTASILSGTLAERVKLWSFFLFTLILTAFIYPVIGAWRGVAAGLNQMGFQDFAGSTIVQFHRRVGGTGRGAGSRATAQEVPGRRHRQADPTVERARGDPRGIHPLAGVVRVQRGSQLALAGVSDAVAISIILVNTIWRRRRGDGGDLRVQTHFGET